jgi:hypothetical protein
VLAGYTKMNVSYEFAANQNLALDATAWTVQAIASKKLALLTVYAAAGYNSSNVNLNINGTYELLPAQGPVPAQFITDPVALSQTGGGPRMTGGVRIRLALINIHADYTLQKFPTVSAGIGVGLR